MAPPGGSAPPKRGAAAGRWGAALGAALLARGVGGNLSTIAGSEAWAEPPTVTWLHPPKGHVMGGAQVTIYGRGFQQTPYLQAKFASENEVDSVPCRFVGKSEIVCESPVRNSVGTVQVTASNDGITFSGYELVYIRGSGTFLKFIYDNSDPGCLDCLNTPSSGDCGLGEGAGGRNCLNPYFVNEVWDVDNATGPYVGGTEVTISAVGLNFPGDPYDLYISSWSSNSGTDSP